MTWFHHRNDRDHMEAHSVHLHHEFYPKGASRSECHRFLYSFGPSAAPQHLRAYLEWKKAHGLSSEDDNKDREGNQQPSSTAAAANNHNHNNNNNNFHANDAADWDRAIRAAHKFHHDNNNDRSMSCTDEEDDDDDEEEEQHTPVPPLGGEEGGFSPCRNGEKIMKSCTDETATTHMPPLQACQVQQIVALAPPPPHRNSNDHDSSSSSSSNDDHDDHDDNNDADDAMRDRDGHRVFYVMPARMHLQMVSKEVYTTAFALYIYRKLRHFDAADSNKNSDNDKNNKGDDCNDDDYDTSKTKTATQTTTTKYTLAVDTRPAPGWPNVPVHHMLGMIRYTVNALHRLFPDRVARILVFPVPTLAVTVYECIAKPFLHADLCRTLTLHAGPAGRTSPLPALAPCLTTDQCRRLEQLRRRAFGK